MSSDGNRKHDVRGAALPARVHHSDDLGTLTPPHRVLFRFCNLLIVVVGDKISALVVFNKHQRIACVSSDRRFGYVK